MANGKDVCLWDDNWIFQYPIRNVIDPPPFSKNLKVSEVIDSHGNCWN